MYIDNPIRRAQLIVPFGVGATYINKDGIRMLIAGVDKWFSDDTNQGDYKIDEWRLSRRLNVGHFRLPPDYRQPVSGTSSAYMSIPTVRFPQWHHCASCKRLTKESLSARGVLHCQNGQCSNGRRKSKLTQVDLICCCEHGHIHDFPWNEWVHGRSNPQCSGNQLRLIIRGYISDAQVVCNCGAKRSLTQTLSADDFSSAVHKADGDYLCNGTAIWHGTPIKQEPCGAKLYPLLLMRNNVYFPVVHSSIYVPRSQSDIEEIINIIESNKAFYDFLVSQNNSDIQIAQKLRSNSNPLKKYTEQQIVTAIAEYRQSSASETSSTFVGLPETQYRRDEYYTLSRPQNNRDLIVVPQDMSKYGEFVRKYFTKIHLITKLRETRVHEGFYRYKQNADQGDVKHHMFRTMPADNDMWLPAVVNIGEGFFLEFNSDLLKAWEIGQNVAIRKEKLKFTGAQMPPNQPYIVTPRAIMLHTFAHLMINRLAYSSGYNVASIRERVYVSESANMAGILIYTSSSDSEGSLGGLVRQALPNRFDALLCQALEYARWCSNDPVCSTDIALNDNNAVYTLAACHSCGLLPETSCEFMNMFLDRAMVINNLAHQDSDIGFFKDTDLQMFGS
jgi:hypothetical protein